MKPLVRFRSKLQGWGGEGRVKFEPIRIESRLGPSAFTGESWLVTSRARFGAGYFGIEPGTWSNLFPDRRSRNPTLVLFTFSNLIQPLSRSTTIYTWRLVKFINTPTRVLYVYSPRSYWKWKLHDQFWHRYESAVFHDSTIKSFCNGVSIIFQTYFYVFLLILRFLLAFA